MEVQEIQMNFKEIRLGLVKNLYGKQKNNMNLMMISLVVCLYKLQPCKPKSLMQIQKRN